MLAGIKIHLMLYGILITALGWYYWQAEHYHDKAINLSLILKSSEAAYKAKEEENHRLRAILLIEKDKLASIEAEHKKAISDLDRMRTTNETVKTYLDISIPTELNNWLRNKYSGNKGGKTNSTRKPVKRVPSANLYRKHNKRFAYVGGELRFSIKKM